MAITLKAVFSGGRECAIRDFDDLREAVKQALAIANDYGIDHNELHETPYSVRIYVEGKMEFSVRIIRGGLAARATALSRVGTT